MDTYESVMPLLSLSLINVFNPTELYSLPGNITGKRYASYVYIGEQLVIIYLPSAANRIAVTTLLLMCF